MWLNLSLFQTCSSTTRNSSTHTLSRLQEEARNFSTTGGGAGGILKSPESEHPPSEGSPSLDLLLQFQRLLISRIFSSKSAAEGKLVGSGCEEVKGQVKCKDGDAFKVCGETSKLIFQIVYITFIYVMPCFFLKYQETRFN